MSISDVIRSIEREMYINAVEKGNNENGNREGNRKENHRERRANGADSCKRQGLRAEKVGQWRVCGGDNEESHM